MSTTGWFIGFIGLIGLMAMVVGIMAAATYSQNADFSNQTDSFGKTHTPLENGTAGSIGTASTGTAGIGSGILLMAAAVCLIVIMVALYSVLKRPKW